MLDTWSTDTVGKSVSYLNQLLNDPELDALVKRAIEANSDVEQALISFQIIQTQFAEIQSARMPRVDLNISASQHDNRYSSTALLSWEVDMWAKLADRSAASAKDAAEQLALYQAAKDSVAAQVMKGWLMLINFNRRISIEQQRVDVLARNETIILQRYRLGIGNLEELDTARTSLNSARAALASVQENLQKQQRAMNVLLGRVNGGIKPAVDYPEVLLPLTELPAQTLQRRFDLKAAFFAVEAADLRTRVAYKSLLPSLSLSGSLADSGVTLSDALFKDPLWSLLGELSAPLFRAGQLKAAVRAAELRAARAYANYRGVLLSAVQEVENAIGLEQSFARQQVYLQLALKSAERSLEQSQQKHREGLSSLLDLLQIQRQLYDLQLQYNDLVYQRLANRITLGLALGLGYKETPAHE